MVSAGYKTPKLDENKITVCTLYSYASVAVSSGHSNISFYQCSDSIQLRTI